MTVSRESGFTLVEMLVALFVLSLLTTAGTAMLMQTLDGKEQVEARSDVLREIDLARATLKSDIGQAVARPVRGLYGARADQFFAGGDLREGDSQTILFLVRRGWENPGALERRGSLQAVEYRIEDGALIRIARTRPDAMERTPEQRRVLLSGVQEANLEFARAGQWSPEWFGGVRAAPQLPEIVRLTLTLEGVGEVDQLFMTGEAF